MDENTFKNYNGYLLPDFAALDGIDSQSQPNGHLTNYEAAIFVAHNLSSPHTGAAFSSAYIRHCTPEGIAALNAAIPQLFTLDPTEEQLARMSNDVVNSHLGNTDAFLEAQQHIASQLRTEGSPLYGLLSEGATLGEAATYSLPESPETNVSTGTHHQLAAISDLLNETQTQLGTAIAEWRADQQRALPQGIDIPTGEQVCSLLHGQQERHSTEASYRP